MDDHLPAVNVGLIGLGFAGTCLHLPPLKLNPRVMIEVACDEDSLKTEAFRHNHADADARTTSRWEDVVTDPAVHAVFIATPTPTHKEIALKALENGKHVFCEKPVAPTLDDAKEMHEAAQRKPGQLLMVGQVLRYWPDYVEAHNIVRHGKLGEVSIARTSRCTGMPSGWYADEAQSGGVILDLALHDIDFLIWTFGEVESVFAQGENCLGKGGSDFVDYAQIHLNFASGAIAHLEASWAVPTSFPFTTSLEICGSEGMLQMDNSEQSTSLETFLHGCHPSKSGPSEFNGYFYEIDAFVKAIINKETKAPIDVSDVVHPLEVAMAAKQSIRSGKTIKLTREKVGAAR
jgi:UDP-N-acetylglucosamine 3-dehydrogenase